MKTSIQSRREAVDKFRNAHHAEFDVYLSDDEIFEIAGQLLEFLSASGIRNEP